MEQLERRCDVVWGLNGLAAGPPHPVTVIVDVLSFSTTVLTACEASVPVYPWRWGRNGAAAFADRLGGVVAAQRQDAGSLPSLSPRSWGSWAGDIPVVLPSPNGATLAAMSRAPLVVCACLRNAQAAARFVTATSTGSVLLVAAGERWPDGSLRPALEDLIGVGAVLAGMDVVDKGIEARAAEAVFREALSDLQGALRGTESGRELEKAGFAPDVDYASRLNCSDVVPRLTEGYFENAETAG